MLYLPVTAAEFILRFFLTLSVSRTRFENMVYLHEDINLSNHQYLNLEVVSSKS